jgi:hypothetical protein
VPDFCAAAIAIRPEDAIVAHPHRAKPAWHAAGGARQAS